MADPHKNFVTSLVAVAPSPATSGVSLTVTTGDGTLFPDPATLGAYNAIICPAGTNPTAANAEIVRVTAKSGDVLTITRTQESTSARTVVVGDQIYVGPTAKTFTDIEGLAVSTISGDTTLVAETLYKISGGHTLTLPLCSANTGKKIVIVKTDDKATTTTLNPNAADTIAGLTTYAMTETNQFLELYSDGGTVWRVTAHSPDVQRFAAGGGTTWTKPPWCTRVHVICIGGGGGGGSGGQNASGTSKVGGSGGGGGAMTEAFYDAVDLAATITVTVGGATGNAAATNDGAIGNVTTFGALLSAFGGGGGKYGGITTTSTVTASGGSGGGSGGAGLVGNVGTPSTAVAGGDPTNGTNQKGVGGGGGGTSTATAGQPADEGGGGGGASRLLTGGFNGGTSINGGGGGGAGGGVSTSTISQGGDGGSSGTFNTAGGGEANHGASGAVGTNGALGTDDRGGGGGGGGGAVSAAVGKTGGDGGTPGGGGGGGGAGTTGGTGGKGAAGSCTVVSW